jgi:ABC-type Zn uptake system ZnuABC Zn-binding protein ZnuA
MFLVLAAGLCGCASGKDPWGADSKSPRVVTTIAPLACFVQNVGGDHVSVICLCTSRGPHHFEYNIQDSQLLRRADLFLSVGLKLDDAFADRLEENSQNPQMRHVKLGQLLPRKMLIRSHEHEGEHGDKDHDEEEHGHAEGHEHHGHQHGAFDPHVWLGIDEACAMVELIRDELKKVDADEGHQADYDRNAEEYIKTLRGLRKYGKDKLAGKKNKKLISFHESLNYFARSFGLEVVDSMEEGPGDEPTADELRKLTKKCRAEGVHVIAVEPQFAQQTSAKTLEDELKKDGHEMKRVVVDPLETVDDKDLQPIAGTDSMFLQDKHWYETHMRKNLMDLAAGLP